jgi:cell division protein FtsA
MEDITKKTEKDNTDNKSEIIVGLDIGTTKITAIVGKKDQYGKLEILGTGKAVSNGVSRGVVANIDKTVDSIKIAIEDAERESGITIEEVYVGIAGQHIKSLQHRGEMVRDDIDEEITKSDLDKLDNNMFKLVTLAGEEVIHVIPQEYTVDGEDFIQDPKGMAGVKIEANFHIITAKSAAVKNIIRCVTKAGLKPKDLILEPFASAEAVLDSDELQEGVCLVDIGGGTTDIAIFLDGIIRHTAVIPFGGNVITKDIKQGIQILEKQAEMLKVKFGSAMSSSTKENVIVSIPGLREKDPKEVSVKNLSAVIEARMREIIDLVNYQIQCSGYSEKLMTGIVLTGGGSQLRNLPQLFAFITGEEVRIGYPNEHLGKHSKDLIKSPIYSTGIGLVQKGFEDVDWKNVIGVPIPENPELIEEPSITPKSKSGIGGKLKEMLENWFSDDEIN